MGYRTFDVPPATLRDLAWGRLRPSPKHFPSDARVDSTTFGGTYGGTVTIASDDYPDHTDEAVPYGGILGPEAFIR